MKLYKESWFGFSDKSPFTKTNTDKSFLDGVRWRS